MAYEARNGRRPVLESAVPAELAILTVASGRAHLAGRPQPERIPMTTRRLSFSSSGLSLADTKGLARRAHARAHAAGGPWATAADRAWAETLMIAEDKPREVQAELYRRTEHLCVLFEDRARWER
jgi:hypothetical protein